MASVADASGGVCSCENPSACPTTWPASSAGTGAPSVTDRHTRSPRASSDRPAERLANDTRTPRYEVLAAPRSGRGGQWTVAVPDGEVMPGAGGTFQVVRRNFRIV